MSPWVSLDVVHPRGFRLLWRLLVVNTERVDGEFRLQLPCQPYSSIISLGISRRQKSAPNLVENSVKMNIFHFHDLENTYIDKNNKQGYVSILRCFFYVNEVSKQI